MRALVLTNGIPVMTTIPGTSSVYDESIYYVGGLSASAPITLPNSGSFADANAKDVIIIVNDKIVEVTRDFTVLSVGPTYNQISFTYDLPAMAVVRFRMHLS